MYRQISYWILLWALFFILKLTSYNPIFYLLFIYIITSLSFIYLFLKNTSPYNLQKFIIVNLLHKITFILIIAFYYPISFNYNDINFGLIIGFIYLLFMILINQNPLLYYNYYLDYYIYGETTENKNYIGIFDKYYDNLFLKSNK